MEQETFAVPQQIGSALTGGPGLCSSGSLCRSRHAPAPGCESFLPQSDDRQQLCSPIAAPRSARSNASQLEVPDANSRESHSSCGDSSARADSACKPAPELLWSDSAGGDEQSEPHVMKGSSWLPGAVYRARLAEQKMKKGGKGKSKGKMKGKKGKKSK